MILSGSEVRRIRQLLGEDQTTFGKRFGKTRRTIIRWEQSGTDFSEWGGWRRDDGKTPADLWRALVALAESKKQKKSKPAAVKRRRGKLPVRRRSVVRAKKKQRRAKR